MNQQTNKLLFEKQLAFHITSRCNLNCNLCSVLIPYMKQRKICKDTPLEQIQCEIDEVFRIYDYINDITLSGGEPLLHPDIEEIIEYCIKFKDKFDSLRIFSNGTVVPNDDLMNLLKKYSNILELVIDDYGSEVSRKVAKIQETFEKNKMPLRINHYHGNNQHCNGWVDYGSPEIFRNYSENQLTHIFKTCHSAQYKCITVYNGKISNCAWAMFGEECGMFSQENTVDLLSQEISLEEKKYQVSKFGQVPLEACQYCNGFDIEHSKRYPAGEQLVK